jgi:hypothetical protein
MIRKGRRRLRPTIDRLDERCLLSGMTPTQLINAYGLKGLTFNSANGTVTHANGAGQTIAIVTAYHNPKLSTALKQFDAKFGLPAPPSLVQQNLAGSATDSGWATETATDVEVIHAIAPAAKIIVVEAKSPSIPDLVEAIDMARRISGVSVVSMSFGGSEMPDEASYDSTFTTPTGHTGVTFVASSGDSGPSAGAQWPASSPNVLSVGGTTLTLGPNGSYGSESLWSGSGGGVSRYEPEPAYQRSMQSTGKRSVPDVTFDADPNTGVMIYSIDPATNNGEWLQVGGTSVGAPAWSAIIALANQERATAGLGTLKGSSQTLPMLYSAKASAFHPVSGGSSGVHLAGLGSPNGAALISSLTSSTSATAGGSSNTGTTAPTPVPVPAPAPAPAPVYGWPWGPWSGWLGRRRTGAFQPTSSTTSGTTGFRQFGQGVVWGANTQQGALFGRQPFSFRNLARLTANGTWFNPPLAEVAD